LAVFPYFVCGSCRLLGGIKKGPDFKELRLCSDFEGIGTFGTKIGIVHCLQNLLEIGMVVSHSEHTIHRMPVMAQLWMNLNSVSI
jgi:hypothetical protein